jgi:two-component system KDP operon response regulator KdpE
MLKVLIIENDRLTAKDILLCLKMRYPGLSYVLATEGKTGIEMIETELPDIVLLSSHLPDMDTIALVGSIREFSDVPILMISEPQTDMDRARCLEAGVDEYVNKPLNAIVLLSVTNALLRRTYGITTKPENIVIIDGDLTIDLNKHEVYRSDSQIHLTPIEFDLLAMFVKNSGRILSHRILLQRVWGSEYISDMSYLKKYIYRLRSKLEPEPERPKMLITERGLGYKLVKSA